MMGMGGGGSGGGGGDEKGPVDTQNKRSTIPARLVLKLLKSWCGPSIVVMYLEKYLKNTNNTMAALHNELVFLYLDLIQKGEVSGLASSRSSNGSSSSSSSKYSALMDKEMLRKKLHSFLKSSTYYKPELMLGRFPENELLEERAVVLSRLKDHREALAIYVWDLNDLHKAHRYCMKHHDYHRAHDKDVYLHLLHVLLRPECVDSVRLKSKRADGDGDGADAHQKTPKPKLDEAMKILLLDHKRIDVPKAMDLLPEDLSITRVFPILKAVLSHNKATSRRNQVTKSLHRIDNLTVRSEWIRTRSQQVRIDNITKCHHCSRRIGNAAFVRYPDDRKNKQRPIVVHYVCSESFQASQAAGSSSSGMHGSGVASHHHPR
uniref:Vacuolar sorting protein 39/Transforming growth factor beta receptor-associated zinc finger domain-containing protein n=1 Tax=Lotharella oceanica TaxID=641309 RepID=A0A7S2U140_9EUKA|mmetsp:Transcript_4828/g.9607  ORF Transcript_4828/g.9607 Transcript_4828/m.9607 type:complete len:376 (+) Transcript_4828:538-1665(+)